MLQLLLVLWLSRNPKNLTDEETVQALMGDLFVRYALNIDDPLTDDNAYLTRQAYWSFKNKIRVNNLDGLIFDSITMGLAKLHDVDTSHVKMDSTHVHSNMKNLTRGGL
jgi:hypothetical protein